MQLLGHFGGADNTQNTVLCLFAPDAPGVSADSFPTEESIYFGTRPGRRRLFMPQFAKISPEKAAEILTDVRKGETGGVEPPPAILNRMVWEYRNVVDGEGMAKVMDALAAEYPAKPSASEADPLLPVMPNLVQALNIASADTRGVIAVVYPDSGPDEELEQTLSSLVFEEGIAGRAHVARLTASEWANAREVALVTGGELATGVFFVAPDPFGLDGEVWVEISADAPPEELRQELVAVLERFRKEWRKLDRVSHLRLGTSEGISWTEYDPDAGGNVLIGEGSKKLGAEFLRH